MDGNFYFSDGFEDVNDSIRGKGTYQRVMAGIDALKKEKKSRVKIALCRNSNNHK